MAKKVTIKSLQDKIKQANNFANDLAKDNLNLLKSRAELKDKIEILTRQSEFEKQVQEDYILSNKHIRDMERRKVEMEYEKTKISNSVFDIIVNVAGAVLPGLLNSLVNPQEKETNSNPNSKPDGK